VYWISILPYLEWNIQVTFLTEVPFLRGVLWGEERTRVHIDILKSNRALNGADPPCAPDDSGWSVLQNNVSHTSELIRKNHCYCDNTTKNSVTSFPAAFYRLEKTALQRFCIGTFQNKSYFMEAWKFKESNYHKTFLLPCLPGKHIWILNFAALYLRPALPTETPVGG